MHSLNHTVNITTMSDVVMMRMLKGHWIVNAESTERLLNDLSVEYTRLLVRGMNRPRYSTVV